MHQFKTMRLRLAVLAGGVILGTGTPCVLAQAPASNDLIERAKALQRSNEQQASSAVKTAIDDATKLGASQAAQNLKLVRLNLDLRSDISSSKRDELITLVSTAIQKYDKTPAAAPLDPKIALKKDENKKALELAAQEAKDIHEAVQGIAKDYEAKNPKDAQLKITEIARKYPNNPSVFALRSQGGTASAIEESKYLSEEQGRRFLVVQNDIANSAMPAIGDIEYPKGWKEKMDRRRRLELPLVGPEEKKILEALEKPITGGIKSAPFEESLQSLSTMIDTKFYLDKTSLDELSIDLRKPVDVPGNVSARTALRAMLQSQGLTFIIKDKVLQVVSVAKAKENMVTRSYEIRDLVQIGGPFNGAVTWGPYLDFEQTQANAQMMIDAISGSIDPMIWKNKSGPATITFHYPSMSIIVRAPSEVHSDLSKSLGRR